MAILRDQDADTRLWIRWAERWVYAKQAGSLAPYLQRPSLRTLDLIEITEEEIGAIKAEKWEREEKIRKRKANGGV